MKKTKKATATKFLSWRTPETEKAVAALQQVFDKLGAGRAEDTYATALKARFLEEWKRSKKVTQSHGRICVQKIRGKKCALPYSDCECTPPGADHATLWSKDGKPTFYVSQPYELDMATIEKMNEFCKKHELAYDIDGRGAFYNPGAVLMVVFYHPND
jgi:hypothetical protein